MSNRSRTTVTSNSQSVILTPEKVAALVAEMLPMFGEEFVGKWGADFISPTIAFIVNGLGEKLDTSKMTADGLFKRIGEDVVKVVEAAPDAQGEAGKAADKLTSFNVTASVLAKQGDGSFRFVLSFRPTVRGEEFWKAMGAAVKTTIKTPKTVERTDDHLLVQDGMDDSIVTHWAIIRSSQRCPICGQPKQTPSVWCKSDFCEAARIAEPTEKKARRVEDPSAIDF